MVTHTVTVVISFPISSAKAAEVLERWRERKEERKGYMRRYRSGSMKRKGGDVSRGTQE